MVTSIKGNDTSTFGGAVDLGANNLTTTGNADVGQVVTDAPAFRAYLSAVQALTAGETTKIAFDTESFDLTSDYDTTNYRFTPSVEGYYQVNVILYVNITGRGFVRLYKNGEQHIYMGDIDSTNTRHVGGSGLIYMNGTTDYIEVYGWRELTGNIAADTESKNHFSAYLARAA